MSLLAPNRWITSDFYQVRKNDDLESVPIWNVLLTRSYYSEYTHETCLRAMSRLAWIGGDIWSLWVVEPHCYGDQGVGTPHREQSEGRHMPWTRTKTKTRYDKIEWPMVVSYSNGILRLILKPASCSLKPPSEYILPCFGFLSMPFNT